MKGMVVLLVRDSVITRVFCSIIPKFESLCEEASRGRDSKQNNMLTSIVRLLLALLRNLEYRQTDFCLRRLVHQRMNSLVVDNGK